MTQLKGVDPGLSGYSAWEALHCPDKSPLPDPLAGLRIADNYLEQVLRGQALLLQDGAIGTQLQAYGAADGGRLPDLACLEQPEIVQRVHSEYVQAGAQMVTTNTFSSNELKLKGVAKVEDLCAAAVQCARSSKARYVAGSMGPLGTLLEPFGDLSSQRAYELFSQQAKALAQAGADLITIETMTDLREAKLALLATRAACDLPIIASVSYEENHRSLFGTPPEVVAATLSALGAQVVGVNCSLGPKELLSVVKRLLCAARCPVAVRPNAGMPRLENGKTIYDVTPGEFKDYMRAILDAGASIVGGCCGTNPTFTADLALLIEEYVCPRPHSYLATWRACSSRGETLIQEDRSLEYVSLIGDDLQGDAACAACEKDTDTLFDEVSDAIDNEAQLVELDLHKTELPEHEADELCLELIEELEESSPFPLCISLQDEKLLEKALVMISGKPALSLRADFGELSRLLPLAKQYGCSLVFTTQDGTALPPELQRALLQAGIPLEDVAVRV